MKRKLIFMCMAIMVLFCINSAAIHAADDSVVYVSAAGDDGNAGLSAGSPLKTVGEAYKRVSGGGSIVLLDNVTYADAAAAYSGNVVIKGNAGTEAMTLPSAVSLRGNLKIENLVLSGAATIYANGYTFEIADNVTSGSRLAVYGGKNGSACESTDLRLYGGLYSVIYGGGLNGAVTGNTNVILGGNANPGDGINDDASDISPCFVYGGGNGGKVSGSTNVTLSGNAVTKYIVGAGRGSGGACVNTNINIEGGKVMNVYGGSADSALTLTNCDTHINMTGGTAEALFGGCEFLPMTGNTYITVKGGEVTRRIYTGCYNDASSRVLWLEWASTNNHVTGTTNLTIYPAARLAEGSGLSGTNGVNKGVFVGSRMKSAASDEKNTVIFADGSYSTHKGKLGEQGLLHKSDFKSFHNYTINADVGGAVEPSAAGYVKVIPDAGYGAVVGSDRYALPKQVEITSGAVTAVSFEGITSVAISGAEVSVGVNTSVSGDIIAALYNGDELASCFIQPFTAGTGSYTFSMEQKPMPGYIFKVLLWDGAETIKAYTREYVMNCN